MDSPSPGKGSGSAFPEWADTPVSHSVVCPPKRYVGVPTPNTLECDHIWK